jgi:Leucine-rich repeat (LRR) protein
MEKITHLFVHRKDTKHYFHRHGKKYLFGTLWAFAVVKMVLLFVWFFSTLDFGMSYAQTEGLLSKETIISMGCPTDAITCELSNRSITTIESDAFVNHTQLQVLNLSFNQLTGLDWVEFPSLLGNLSLISNQIASLDWVEFPDSLQVLNLDNNQLTSVDWVEFPDSLVYVKFSNNQLTNLDWIVLPSSVSYLDFSFNQITGISWLILPSSLKELYLNENQLTSLDWLEFSDPLSILYLAGNQITNISWIEFPDSLLVLNLAENQLTSLDWVEFPDSLRELFFYDNQITSLSWVVLPSSLNVFYFFNNQLTSIDWIEFPSSLKILLIHRNKLTSVPESIMQLANLSDNWWLNVDYNYIEFDQLSPSLLAFIDQKSEGNWRSTQQTEAGQVAVGWCTDVNANNYNPDATYDNWSCLYGEVGLPSNIWDWSIDGMFLMTQILPDAKIYSGGLLPFLIAWEYSEANGVAWGEVHVWVPLNFEYQAIEFGSNRTGWDIVYGKPGDRCYADFIQWTGKYVEYIDTLLEETILPQVLECDNSPELSCQLNIPELSPDPIPLSHSAEIYSTTGMKAWVWAIVDVFNLLWIMLENDGFIGISNMAEQALLDGVPPSTIISQVSIFVSNSYDINTYPVFEIILPSLGWSLWLETVETCGNKVYSTNISKKPDSSASNELYFFGKHGYVPEWFDIYLFVSSEGIIDTDISNNMSTIHIDLAEWEWMNCANRSETAIVADGNIGEIFINSWWCQSELAWCSDGDLYLIWDWLLPIWDQEFYANNICMHGPRVSLVSIVWETLEWSVLTWEYIYSWEIKEWLSEYQWYRNNIPIDWAKQITYIVSGEDLWKTLYFEVTPLDEDGKIRWKTVMSAGLYIPDPNNPIWENRPNIWGFSSAAILVEPEQVQNLAMNLNINNQSNELVRAYAYSYLKWITTMPTMAEADMHGPLSRIALAKMISKYVLSEGLQEIDTNKKCDFPDVPDDLNKDYDDGVTKACQLGLMGVWIEEFNPEGIVVRAEFGTVLSRALWWDKYNSDEVYYEKHLEALKKEWIMTKIDKPFDTEQRWWTMLTFLRAWKMLLKNKNH